MQRICGSFPRRLPFSLIQFNLWEHNEHRFCAVTLTYRNLNFSIGQQQRNSNDLIEHWSKSVTKLESHTTTPTEENLNLNIICRICKRRGHIASRCPRARGICYRCHSPEHTIKDCPEPRKCNHCGSHSHISQECPNVICLNCYKKGHTKHNCTEEKICYRCGKVGHVSRDCDVLVNKKIL